MEQPLLTSSDTT